MKLIVAGLMLDSLLQDFVRRFPRLATKGGSFGKCKFISYELALYLRRRGVKAKLLHVQGLAQPKLRSTAHESWANKPSKDWSHYVVLVGDTAIDMTARQFDPKLDHPRIVPRATLVEEWTTVETDSFINRIISEVLRAQTDANRSLRESQVKKLNIDPARASGEPAQQRLRSPVA